MKRFILRLRRASLTAPPSPHLALFLKRRISVSTNSTYATNSHPETYMTIRDHNLDSVAPIMATFKIKQTTPGTDDLKDANLGQAVKLTASNEIGPIGPGDQLLGKLIALTLRDGDDGSR